jgi:hypothetical protein
MSLDCFFRAPERELDREKTMQVLAQMAMEQGRSWGVSEAIPDRYFYNRLVVAGLLECFDDYRLDRIFLRVTQKGLDFLKEDV